MEVVTTTLIFDFTSANPILKSASSPFRMNATPSVAIAILKHFFTGYRIRDTGCRIGDESTGSFLRGTPETGRCCLAKNPTHYFKPLNPGTRNLEPCILYPASCILQPATCILHLDSLNELLTNRLCFPTVNARMRHDATAMAGTGRAG